MRFLCLGYYDAARMDALPGVEIDAVMAECLSHLDVFHATGQVVVDMGLEVETTTLRNTGAGVSVAEGRIVNAPALIGSAFVIDARDIQEAIRVASEHPSLKTPAGARFGWAVEIRPIHTFREPAKAGV